MWSEALKSSALVVTKRLGINSRGLTVDVFGVAFAKVYPVVLRMNPVFPASSVMRTAAPELCSLQ
jgi:hypothetical protein